MRKKTNHKLYRTISFLDVIVIITSLLAFGALIFVIKYSEEKSRSEVMKLAESSQISQAGSKEGGISELAEYLIINEVNQEGWIELYNKHSTARLELSNCYITVNNEKKYTFSEQEGIEAGKLLCVEGLGALDSTKGLIIGIYDEQGESLKSLLLPELKQGESYGCIQDGDISCSYLTESKNASNNKSSMLHKEELSFSVPGGFYDESFQLEITGPEGSRIYYTLDGSKPTTESELYTKPITIENKSGTNMRYATAEGIEYQYSYRPSSISMGMTVRAIAVDAAGNSSKVKTQSYFIGFRNASDIRNLPVLSLVADPADLFDYFDGIYVTGRSHEDALARGEDGANAANYLNDWEREVHVEYFEPKKDKTFEGTMSLSIIKDINVAFPQKSLLLTAEGGALPGSSLGKYYNEISRRLVVQTNRKDNHYKFREYLAASLLKDTSVGAPEIAPCIVFINGEYWGAYMLKGEYDERYLSRHYGVDEDEVLIAVDGLITNRSGYQTELNELYEYMAEHDLKEDKHYAWVKDHMDIRNYLEYFCANMYLANAEYGTDKLVMWRCIQEEGKGYEDGRWRFLMPRLDNSMKNKEAGKVATSSVNTYLQEGLQEDDFFKHLIRNDEFKQELLSVMTEMADQVFAPERAKAAISNLSGRIKKMAIMSYRRFTGNIEEAYYSKELERIEGFFEERREYILRYTEEVISWGGISNLDDAVFE